jgi:[CysO sulfur-carrier protein]-S-L-cysteine hydrolase
MQTISLTQLQIDELVRVANVVLPDESCALLLGQNDRVLEILPMRNADESSITFSIDPDELLRAYDVAESKGLEVIAVFHSHPSRPSPSSTDRKFMEINPVVWLIYSTTEHTLKAYVYRRDVEDVAIKITAMG